MNVFQLFNVDRQLSGLGLAVDDRYSRRGIATKMLQARVLLMKLHDLKVSATIFSGLLVQKAAKAANFKDIYARSYADIGRDFSKFDFSNSDAKEFKIMTLEI